MRALLISALSVLLVSTTGPDFAPPAFAHGDASWIMENPKTRNCCGPKDCRRMEPGEVVIAGRGWTVVATGEHVEGVTSKLYDSIDDHFWICRHEGAGGPGTGVLRCLLVPRTPS
jgi:hypothetical protein